MSKIVDPRIKKFKKIIAIDTYTDTYYQYKKQTLKRIDNLLFDNSNFVISYIKNKDMIIASFDLGFGIEDDEIDDMIYMKAYDELGLDPEKEYLIKHRKANSDAESGVYNLFIIEPEIIEESCAKVIEKTTYIDLLIPAPLMYETLYTTNILEPSEAHCFIYFTMDDAFVTIYKDGQFLYSKSLEFSLNQIYDRYCAMIGEKIDKKKFFETLEGEGLKATDSFFQQNIMKLFGEIFLQINDIIIYTKRAYGIDVIQRLFLGSVQSPIIGLGDYGYNYLGIPTYNLDYNFDMKNDEWYVDQFQYMMVQSGLDYIENPSKFVNLTTTPRPPVFSKRASGQFIISTTVVSLLAIGYPLFFLVKAYMIDAHIIKLSSENKSLTQITNKYKKILNEKRKIISQNKKELKGLENIFEAKAKTLTSIYNKKVDYRLKSNLLNKFAIDLVKYELKLERMSSNENEFTIHIVSDDDKKITKYIKYISEKYFNDIENIDIKRISVSKDGLYRGILKVSYI